MNKYNLIYADPPWSYNAYNESKRAIKNHYPTMTLEEICDLPVSSIAAKDCILAMWITGPHLDKITRVFDAWGFKYRGILFTWLKVTESLPTRFIYGMGFYTRKNSEILVYGKLGNPGKPSKAYDEIIMETRKEHSVKPKLIYERLQSMWPKAKRVELFARNYRDGWESWGNEIEPTSEVFS